MKKNFVPEDAQCSETYEKKTISLTQKVLNFFSPFFLSDSDESIFLANLFSLETHFALVARKIGAELNFSLNFGHLW